MENQDVEMQKEVGEDELYAKIQTEKLLKKKKTKKIYTLVGVCFAFVVAIIFIILGAVPVSLMPKCISTNFEQVTLFSGSTSTSMAFEKGEDGYKEFQKVLKKAFSQTYLSALFSGNLTRYIDIDETYTDETSAIGTNGTLISSETYYVYLQYTNPQVLTQQNGKVYESIRSHSNWDGKLTFDRAYIVVSTEEGLQEAKIYLPVKYPEFDDDEYVGESKSKKVSITVKANTNTIYKAWEDLLQF